MSRSQYRPSTSHPHLSPRSSTIPSNPNRPNEDVVPSHSEPRPPWGKGSTISTPTPEEWAEYERERFREMSIPKPPIRAAPISPDLRRLAQSLPPDGPVPNPTVDTSRQHRHHHRPPSAQHGHANDTPVVRRHEPTSSLRDDIPRQHHLSHPVPLGHANDTAVPMGDMSRQYHRHHHPSPVRLEQANYMRVPPAHVTVPHYQQSSSQSYQTQPALAPSVSGRVPYLATPEEVPYSRYTHDGLHKVFTRRVDLRNPCLCNNIICYLAQFPNAPVMAERVTSSNPPETFIMVMVGKYNCKIPWREQDPIKVCDLVGIVHEFIHETLTSDEVKSIQALSSSKYLGMKQHLQARGGKRLEKVDDIESFNNGRMKNVYFRYSSSKTTSCGRDMFIIDDVIY